MESPFVYGKVAKGKSFINRKSELKQLTGNFTSGINTMIISPRRWGKTSLVFKAAEKASRNNKKIKICHLDLYRIQDEKHFFESFAYEVLKASSNKWQEWVSTAKDLLKGTVSSVSIGTDPSNDFSLKISWEDIKKDKKAILNLPDKIARQKKFKFVICIDEFQKVTEFNDSLFFLEQLRSHWQDQSMTSYCLSGNKKHIIKDLFSPQSQPLQEFGDLICLERIKPKHWVGYIENQFIATGKTINRKITDRIIEVAANHPYHIQQLSHHIWRLTEEDANTEIFDLAIEELLLNNDIFFRKEINNLTPLQLRYLNAILNRETHLNSMKIINKYKLGSPGNLSTIKAALETKEIIDFYQSKPIFINPIFEYWLKRG